MNINSAEPLLIADAQLGWKLDRSFIYGDSKNKQPTEQTLKFTPALECGLQMAGEFGDIVLNLQALLQSVRKPGGYFLLTSECGYAEDADIHELIFVQHPSPNKIVWELDVQGLRSALVKETQLTHQEGYVRLIFDRSQYVTDLHRMVAETQQANKELELDEVAGSHLEFKLEDDEVCWINGQKLHGWPPHHFPCWVANRAWKRWSEYFHRGFSMKPNQFYLQTEDDRVACDVTGYELVEILRKCFDESVNSREITVSYSPCNVPIAAKG